MLLSELSDGLRHPVVHADDLVAAEIARQFHEAASTGSSAKRSLMPVASLGSGRA